MYVDLLQIQRFSFLKFLKSGINQVFENVNPLFVANQKYIFYSKYYLVKIPSQINFSLPLDDSQTSPFFFLGEKWNQGLALSRTGQNTENSTFHYEFETGFSSIPCYSYNSLPVRQSKHLLGKKKNSRESLESETVNTQEIDNILKYTHMYLAKNSFKFRQVFSKKENNKKRKKRGNKRLKTPIRKKIRGNKRLEAQIKKIFSQSTILPYTVYDRKIKPISTEKTWKSFIFNKVSFRENYLLLKKNYLKKSFPKGSRTKWNIFFHRPFFHYLPNNIDFETNYKILYENLCSFAEFFSSRSIFLQDKNNQSEMSQEILKGDFQKDINSLRLLKKKYKKKFPSLTLLDNQILPTISFQTKRSKLFFQKQPKKPENLLPSFATRVINKRNEKNLFLKHPFYRAQEFEKTKQNEEANEKDYSYQNLTYSSEFYLPVQIIDQISKKMHLSWFLLVDLLIQTKRGHFIVNGYPKTIVHQILRSPGIRFKNTNNQILADIISVRGAWMGIQIVYEKITSSQQYAEGSKFEKNNISFFQKNSRKNGFDDVKEQFMLDYENKKTLKKAKKKIKYKINVEKKKYFEARAEEEEKEDQEKTKKIDKNYKEYGFTYLDNENFENQLNNESLNFFQTSFHSGTLKGEENIITDEQNKKYKPTTPIGEVKTVRLPTSVEYLENEESEDEYLEDKKFEDLDLKRLENEGLAFATREVEKYLKELKQEQKEKIKYSFKELKDLSLNELNLKQNLEDPQKQEQKEKKKEEVDKKYLYLYKGKIKRALKAKKYETFKRDLKHLLINIVKKKNHKNTILFLKIAYYTLLNKNRTQYLFPTNLFFLPSNSNSMFQFFSIFLKPISKPSLSLNNSDFFNSTLFSINRGERGSNSKTTKQLASGQSFLLHGDREPKVPLFFSHEASGGKKNRRFFFPPGTMQASGGEKGIKNSFFPTGTKNKTKQKNQQSEIIITDQVLTEQNQSFFKIPYDNINKKFPIFENEIIHETLFILFFISSPFSKLKRGEKQEKKEKLKVSGFTFLSYLFDHPYFIYNNFIKFWEPFSQILFQNPFNSSTNPNTNKNLLRYQNNFTEQFWQFHQKKTKSILYNYLKKMNPIYPLPNSKVWSFLYGRFINRQLSMQASESPEFRYGDKNKSINSNFVSIDDNFWMNNKTIQLNHKILNISSLCSSFFSFSPMNRNMQGNTRVPFPKKKRAINQEREKNSFKQASFDTKNEKNVSAIKRNFQSYFSENTQKKLFSIYQSKEKLISILNINNFRNILFERFFNPKYYDIGLMGRKHLNKILRLNIPSQCTTLTSLDFLAVFYKLFSFHYIVNSSFPLHQIGLSSLPSLEKKNSKNFQGSLALTYLANKVINMGSSTKEENLIQQVVTKKNPLDHLNQRHIRTSGEFLFLQFWRATLRFYQLLFRLSTRNNFITAPRPSLNTNHYSFQNNFGDLPYMPLKKKIIRFLPIYKNNNHSKIFHSWPFFFSQIEKSSKLSIEKEDLGPSDWFDEIPFVVPLKNNQEMGFEISDLKQSQENQNYIKNNLQKFYFPKSISNQDLLSMIPAIKDTQVRFINPFSKNYKTVVIFLGKKNINQNDLDTIIPFFPKTFDKLENSEPSVNSAISKEAEYEKSFLNSFFDMLFDYFSGFQKFDPNNQLKKEKIPTKLFNGIFKEFFNLDPLCQQLDETNGLAEIIQKRRISALGNEGVTSINAPLAIRSIHPSFYGRLCPVDSPEGDRVGLMNSLTNYAKVTSTGYIATPFYRTRLNLIRSTYHKGWPPESSLKREKNGDLLKPRISTFVGDKIEEGKEIKMRISPSSSFFGKSYHSYSTFRKKQFFYFLKSSVSFFFSGKDVSVSMFYNKPSSIFKKGIPEFSLKAELNSSFLKRDRDLVAKFKKKAFRNDLPKFYDSNYLISPISYCEIPSSNLNSLLFPRKLIKNTEKKIISKAIFFISFSKIENNRSLLGITTPLCMVHLLLEVGCTEREIKKWKNQFHGDKALKQNIIKSFPTVILNSVKSSKFFTCYFDFISFQGYAPLNSFQFFSPGVSLIPFLEHDDGTRALMGANMQRQAVPLINAERPLVGTGLEKNITTSFIISNHSSSYFYYISGKQTKQIYSGPPKNLNTYSKIADYSMGKNSYKFYAFNQEKFLVDMPRNKQPFGLALSYLSQELFPSIDFRSWSLPNHVMKGKKRKLAISSLTPDSSPSFYSPKVYRRKGLIFRYIEQSPILKLFLEKRRIMGREKRGVDFFFDVETSKKKANKQKKIKSYKNLKREIHKEQYFHLIDTNKTICRQPRSTNYKTSVRRLPHLNKNNRLGLGFPIHKSIQKISWKENFISNLHWLPFRKSYKATCINKKPACSENSWLQKGDLLVDGSSSINGELSLGSNLFSIYMPWKGYNFEDAILISDRVANSYTSIHIEEVSIKLFKYEKIFSIVKPKTWVNQGDNLVSKVRDIEDKDIYVRLASSIISYTELSKINFIKEVVERKTKYTEKEFFSLKKKMTQDQDIDYAINTSLKTNDSTFGWVISVKKLDSVSSEIYDSESSSIKKMNQELLIQNNKKINSRLLGDTLFFARSEANLFNFSTSYVFMFPFFRKHGYRQTNYKLLKIIAGNITLENQFNNITNEIRERLLPKINGHVKYSISFNSPKKIGKEQKKEKRGMAKQSSHLSSQNSTLISSSSSSLKKRKITREVLLKNKKKNQKKKKISDTPSQYNNKRGLESSFYDIRKKKTSLSGFSSYIDSSFQEVKRQEELNNKKFSFGVPHLLGKIPLNQIIFSFFSKKQLLNEKKEQLIKEYFLNIRRSTSPLTKKLKTAKKKKKKKIKKKKKKKILILFNNFF